MINKNDVEKAEQLERKAWELQHQAQMAQSTLSNVVHNTASERRQALAREMQMMARNKKDPTRLAYVRARSSVLKARLKMQLMRSAKEIEALRAAVLEFADEVDLGPLLDSCPE